MRLEITIVALKRAQSLCYYAGRQMSVYDLEMDPQLDNRENGGTRYLSVTIFHQK